MMGLGLDDNSIKRLAFVPAVLQFGVPMLTCPESSGLIRHEPKRSAACHPSIRLVEKWRCLTD